MTDQEREEKLQAAWEEYLKIKQTRLLRKSTGGEMKKWLYPLIGFIAGGLIVPYFLLIYWLFGGEFPLSQDTMKAASIFTAALSIVGILYGVIFSDTEDS